MLQNGGDSFDSLDRGEVSIKGTGPAPSLNMAQNCNPGVDVQPFRKDVLDLAGRNLAREPVFRPFRNNDNRSSFAGITALEKPLISLCIARYSGRTNIGDQ